MSAHDFMWNQYFFVIYGEHFKRDGKQEYFLTGNVSKFDGFLRRRAARELCREECWRIFDRCSSTQQNLESTVREQSYRTLFLVSFSSSSSRVRWTFLLSPLNRAHWCPPCRRFTPKLAQFYESNKSKFENSFEIVFISFDEDEDGFNEYFKEMPWKALPFSGLS